MSWENPYWVVAVSCFLTLLTISYFAWADMRLCARDSFQKFRLGTRPATPFTNVPARAVYRNHVVNCLLQGCVSGAGIILSVNGMGSLYFTGISSFTDFGLVVLQVAYFLLISDAQFYWFHRLFHSHPKLYTWFHHEHHRERYPSAWHAYNETATDFLLSGGLTALVIALLPIPVSIHAYIAALVIGPILDFSGHAGYELTLSPVAPMAPNGIARRLDPHDRHIGRFFNMTVDHDVHHQQPKKNLARYFTFWDHVCGTRSEERRREVLVAMAGAPERTTG